MKGRCKRFPGGNASASAVLGAEESMALPWGFHMHPTGMESEAPAESPKPLRNSSLRTGMESEAPAESSERLPAKEPDSPKATIFCGRML